MEDNRTRSAVFYSMRKIFLFLSLLTASFSQAKEFTIGDVQLDIPVPSGMIEIIPEMGDVYKYFESLDLTDKDNHYLATYISIDDVKNGKENLHICKISTPKAALKKEISKNEFKKAKDTVLSVLSSSEKRMELVNKTRDKQKDLLKDNKFFVDEVFQVNKQSVFTPIINNDNLFMYLLALNLDENNRANDDSELSIIIQLYIKRKMFFLRCNWLNENNDQKNTEEKILNWANKIISKNEESYYEKVLNDIKDTFENNTRFILVLLSIFAFRLLREKFNKKNR